MKKEVIKMPTWAWVVCVIAAALVILYFLLGVVDGGVRL
jgi:hypothetical protein